MVAFQTTLHRLVAPFLLLYGCFQRLFERVGDFRAIIWIDDDCFGQLFGRTRHLAQDQYPCAVCPRSDIFLGD
jgi:hypothetical protein